MSLLKTMFGSEFNLSDVILSAMARLGYDFNGFPDRLYIDKIRTRPAECTIPKNPVLDTITSNGEQAILFLPDSVRRRPKILGPLLRRFPNHLVYGTRRDIVSGNPAESYERVKEICDSSLRYFQEKGINPHNLTVLGICAGNSPATILASKVGARNLYSVLSAGSISEGIFSSEATKNEVAEMLRTGVSQEDYHRLIRDFDPMEHINGSINHIVGVFGGTDLMVKRKAWEPLAQRIRESGGEIITYPNLGHCTSMYRFARDLGRGYL